MDSQHLTPLNLVSLPAKHKVMEDKHRWDNGRDSTSGRVNIRRIVSPHRRSKVITWSETVHCVHAFTWKSWRADRSPSLHETEAFWLPVQQRWSLCSTRQSGWNTEGNPGEPPERGTTVSQPGQHKRVGGMRIGPLTTVMVVNAYRCKWKTSLWQKGTNKQKTCILLAAFEFWDIYKRQGCFSPRGCRLGQGRRRPEPDQSPPVWWLLCCQSAGFVVSGLGGGLGDSGRTKCPPGSDKGNSARPKKLSYSITRL